MTNKTNGTETFMNSYNKFMSSASSDISTPLSKEAQIELIREFQASACPAALDKLYKSNMRLFARIASKYATGDQETFMDLIGQAALALYRSAEKFDIEKGFAFSTYLTTWVRSMMEDALSQKRYATKVPLHTQKLINKVVRAEKRLVETEGMSNRQKNQENRRTLKRNRRESPNLPCAGPRLWLHQCPGLQ
jgi:RNA polymerase primary sigma factor